MPVCSCVWSHVICNVSVCQISWHQIFISLSLTVYLLMQTNTWKVYLCTKEAFPGLFPVKNMHYASELDNSSLKVQLFIFTPCCVLCRQKWVERVTNRAKISGAKILLKACCILAGQSYLIITSEMTTSWWPCSELNE